MEKENIFSLRMRRKTEKEKEGNIFKKENIVLWRRRRTEKENIWRRKMLP